MLFYKSPPFYVMFLPLFTTVYVLVLSAPVAYFAVVSHFAHFLIVLLKEFLNPYGRSNNFYSNPLNILRNTDARSRTRGNYTLQLMASVFNSSLYKTPKHEGHLSIELVSSDAHQ